ncbi:MAG TPA: ubiquinone/menaquinone biosynthesis methyltransferase [Dehalococcoidia bacterium]|nr:ubiquinone/menaquinone biosynthesis methyltransferase [Dehalococcoidia bacterium]
MIGRAHRAVPGRPLHDMFTAVPPRYDLINRIVTWGLDRKWRRRAARECLASWPERVLDLCCGTGDLEIELARQAKNRLALAGIDYSRPMLALAARKAGTLVPGGSLSLISGNAASLPFPDGSLDCVGISFAFRNLTYKNPLMQRHLAEVLRVLRAGGKFVIVETSQPENKLVRKLYHRYLHWFVYPVGYLLSGNRGAYHYFAESAAHFYATDELRGVLIEAGFSEVSIQPILFGAVAIHRAIK